MDTLNKFTGEVGKYLKDDKEYFTNTAIAGYGWGADDSLINWNRNTGVEEVIRECKRQQRIISQDEAKDIAYWAVENHKTHKKVLGKAIHEAINRFFEHKPIPRLTEFQRPYFEAFLSFYEQHTFKPLLVEELFHDDSDSTAGQPDWYGEFDGYLTILDWKTGNSVQPKVGIQLAGYQKKLQAKGYKVQRKFAVHIRPGSKKTPPYAYLIEFFDTPEDYDIVRKSFELKVRRNQPEIYYRTEGHEQKEVSIMPTSGSATIPPQDVQGHQSPQEVRDTSPNILDPDVQPVIPPPRTCFCPADKSGHAQGSPGCQFAVRLRSIHKARLRETPSGGTSSPSKGSQPRTAPLIPLEPGVIVRFDEAATPQIVQDPYSHLLETGTLERQVADWDSELDTQPSPHP